MSRVRISNFDLKRFKKHYGAFKISLKGSKNGSKTSKVKQNSSKISKIQNAKQFQKEKVQEVENGSASPTKKRVQKIKRPRVPSI